MTVDTSNFLTKNGLLSTLGNSETNTITQKGISDAIELKQDILRSGQNIKTINNQSIVGSGNIEIQGGSSLTTITQLLDNNTLSSGTEYTLLDSIENYNYIMILISTESQMQNGSREFIPVEQIKNHYNDTQYRPAMSLFQATNVFWFTDFYFVSATKFKCNNVVKGSVGWTPRIKIYGIN